MRTVDTGRAAACALERRQRDFPKADITRRPVRVPSLHARSGGGLEPFRCGSASCPMHNARRDWVRLPALVGGGSGVGVPRSAGLRGGYCARPPRTPALRAPAKKTRPPPPPVVFLSPSAPAPPPR